MQLVIESTGQVRCVYTETIDLTALGVLAIQRGNRVEPDAQGQWFADLRLVGGPCLGPFGKRSDAVAAEVGWLESHWLANPVSEARK